MKYSKPAAPESVKQNVKLTELLLKGSHIWPVEVSLGIRLPLRGSVSVSKIRCFTRLFAESTALPALVLLTFAIKVSDQLSQVAHRGADYLQALTRIIYKEENYDLTYK